MTIELDQTKVSPQTHRFVGMYRPPLDSMLPAPHPESHGCWSCPCGTLNGNRSDSKEYACERVSTTPSSYEDVKYYGPNALLKIREHWLAGHFDVPQWEPVEAPLSPSPAADWIVRRLEEDERRRPIRETEKQDLRDYQELKDLCRDLGFRFSWDGGCQEREQLKEWLRGLTKPAKHLLPFVSNADADLVESDKRNFGTYWVRDGKRINPSAVRMRWAPEQRAAPGVVDNVSELVLHDASRYRHLLAEVRKRGWGEPVTQDEDVTFQALLVHVAQALPEHLRVAAARVKEAKMRRSAGEAAWISNTYNASKYEDWYGDLKALAEWLAENMN